MWIEEERNLLIAVVKNVKAVLISNQQRKGEDGK